MFSDFARFVQQISEKSAQAFYKRLAIICLLIFMHIAQLHILYRSHWIRFIFKLRKGFFYVLGHVVRVGRSAYVDDPSCTFIWTSISPCSGPRLRTSNALAALKGNIFLQTQPEASSERHSSSCSPIHPQHTEPPDQRTKLTKHQSRGQHWPQNSHTHPVRRV